MIIEKKESLILNLMAFTSLIQELKLKRKSMALNSAEDYKLKDDLECNINNSKTMIRAITYELETKH